MNDVAVITPKAALIARGGPVMAIRPKNIEETFRLAEAMAKTSMVPKGYQGKPMDIMAAMVMGAELGLSSMQSLSSIAVINGTPALWGDGLVAVCRAAGAKISEIIDGDGDSMIATCTVTRPDNGEVVTYRYTVADAKKAGLWGKAGPWQQHPKRMLAMRARGFACRNAMADVLKGFQIAEVLLEDMPTAPADPLTQSTRAALPTSLKGDFAPEITHEPVADDATDYDADTGEVVDDDPQKIGPYCIADFAMDIGDADGLVSIQTLTEDFAATEAWSAMDSKQHVEAIRSIVLPKVNELVGNNARKGISAQFAFILNIAECSNLEGAKYFRDEFLKTKEWFDMSPTHQANIDAFYAAARASLKDA